jgi:hypothetical protein
MTKEKFDIKAVMNIRNVEVTERELSNIYEQISSKIIEWRDQRVRKVKLSIRLR